VGNNVFYSGRFFLGKYLDIQNAYPYIQGYLQENTMMKRIVLFMIMNIAVLFVLSIVASVLGVDRYLTANGLNIQALLAFSALFGFGGAFISLALSKWIAKRLMGVSVISSPQNEAESWLLNTVGSLAKQADIRMPEVGFYDSTDMNAFATGPTKNNSLVAVSTGLMRSMSREEVTAVLGHEIAGHAANGDMVTMTLLQGVLNTFVLFLSRVIGYFVDQSMSRNNEDRGVGFGYFITVIVCQIVFGILATLVLMAFSRRREYKADAASARAVGAPAMISALKRLQAGQAAADLPGQLAAFGISGKASWFSSHPPLEDRIAALEKIGAR
jgi:heat shock protein HtpX